MRCLLVDRTTDGKIVRQLTENPLAELPAGEILVRVQYSSLNYKDALAATGHPGVVNQFPHVPGIDAAGTIVESKNSLFKVGEEVIVTSFNLGAGQWGGLAEYIRVPAEWVVPLPKGLSLRESMILGTAGFTAAMCLEAIVRQQIGPECGEVVVTGASGGVGTIAVAILSLAGYKVCAISGKPTVANLLRKLGAVEVLPREAVVDSSRKPLLKPRWAAAIDTVGGSTLATLLASLQPLGCVAACGLVGGVDLPTTVYPFILRGVTLSGIDSAWYPAALRPALWSKLAGPWKPAMLNELATEVSLGQIEPKIDEILAGKTVGRIVVKI
ncbi:MAG TPA: YhdH/YhfP family quinone oxidoreductase [Pirellulales bacterium]|jgi:putative YhdH/YhfP family quinone oxidoreductase